MSAYQGNSLNPYLDGSEDLDTHLESEIIVIDGYEYVIWEAKDEFGDWILECQFNEECVAQRWLSETTLFVGILHV